MYIFAKNALPLPDSPADYRNNVAYRKTPSDSFISNGIRSNDFLETAQLNDYLFTLTTLVENLITNGMCQTNPGDAWQQNDLKIDADGQTILIYKNNSFVPLLQEATETTNGFIDTSKIFAMENPFSTIPLSKHDVAGSIKTGNTVLKTDFLKLPNASVVQSNATINDDNDMGETRYYSTNTLNIVMFPSRVTSKFYLKHIWCNPKNTTISVNGISYKPTNPDIIVLSDGTVFE
jgi:hypothetical protein